MQDLNKFKNEMNLSGQNVYVGHRYAPVLDDGGWDNTKEYEPLTIIQYQGDSYVSRTYVPKDIDILNKDYWYSIGVYDAQVASYKKRVEDVETNINGFKDEFNNDFKPLLNKTYKRTNITPDDFEGTDVEKLQQAYDYAVLNKIYTINLNRTYDLTGGSIDIGADSWVYKQFIIHGGELVKNDKGFMFTSSANNRSRQAPRFVGTRFISDIDDVYVFDGDKMIAFITIACYFLKIGLVKSSEYIQTLRMTDCETGLLGCDFISSKWGYDIEIKGHKGEQTTSPYHFMNIVSDVSDAISYFGLRLQGLWEGYSNKAPFKLGTGYGLNIDKSYFEKNNTTLHLTTGTGVGVKRTQASITNSVFQGNLSTNDIEIDKGIITSFITVSDNTIGTTSGKYFISRGAATINVLNNNLYTGGKIFNEENASTVLTKNTTYTSKINFVEGTGLNYEVMIPTNTAFKIGDNNELQFLVNLTGTFGTSSFYKGHLTGILSIDTFYIDGAIKSEVMFNVLSSRCTDGDINGSVNNPEEFDYYFKETGTKQIDHTTENPTIVFNLPKFKPHVRNNISFKGVNSLLQKYLDNNK